ICAAGSLSASSLGSSGSAESSSAGSTIPRISWALFSSPASLSSSGDFEIGSTQISIRFEVFNLTDKSIWLPYVTVILPQSHAPIRMKHVSLKDQSSNFHGGYELPPHGRPVDRLT